MIRDNHGRPITYVRIAITDRCNLRCFYCMPAEGIKYVPRKNLLSYEEMERLLRVLVGLGIHKLRITGGEPFLRKGLIEFLERIREIDGLKSVHITTNGVLTTPYVPRFKELGITSVNLSLDTLDRERFLQITRRDELEKVRICLDTLIAHQIPTKINTVVMNGKNTDDIIPMAELTKDHPVGVRYIEEMPFNGSGDDHALNVWNHKKIFQELKNRYPGITKIGDERHSTSRNYQIPGYVGSVGIIPAFSRTFCGSCNRIRITPKGKLKTCLYDEGVWDILGTIRSGATDEDLKQGFLKAFGNRAKDGFEAEARRVNSPEVSESMSTIGG